MKIVFASRNEGKIKEIREMLAGTGIELVSLNDYANVAEIVEDGGSFLENALKKARIISEMTGEMVLADDSGLQVDFLNGEPGIFSSRYAGKKATDEENNFRLLDELKKVPAEKRGASFQCVLILYREDCTYEFFEGKWRGRIIDEKRGSNGFGYDPIFFVPELRMTAAELPAEIKNRVSHRGQAFAKLKSHLIRELKKR
jgi:XTP/dITP diphosphohydrolase